LYIGRDGVWVQVTSLELVCRQHESSLKEREGTIAAQRSELDKHAEVAALIHSLSGGKRN